MIGKRVGFLWDCYGVPHDARAHHLQLGRRASIHHCATSNDKPGDVRPLRLFLALPGEECWSAF